MGAAEVEEGGSNGNRKAREQYLESLLSRSNGWSNGDREAREEKMRLRKLRAEERIKRRQARLWGNKEAADQAMGADGVCSNGDGGRRPTTVRRRWDLPIWGFFRKQLGSGIRDRNEMRTQKINRTRIRTRNRTRTHTRPISFLSSRDLDLTFHRDFYFFSDRPPPPPPLSLPRPPSPPSSAASSSAFLDLRPTVAVVSPISSVVCRLFLRLPRPPPRCRRRVPHLLPHLLTHPPSPLQNSGHPTTRYSSFGVGRSAPLSGIDNYGL